MNTPRIHLSGTPTRVLASVRRHFGRRISAFGLSFLAAAFASAPAASAGSCCAAVPEPAPTAAVAAAPLPDRSLYQLDAGWTDDTGAARTLADLRGRPVVFTMFFARCGTACPRLVARMKQLQAALPAARRRDVQFVLVSFDAEGDTPAVLTAFREGHGLDGSWHLLRGSAADVRTLALLLGVSFKREASGQFAHANIITVLDAEGRIAHQLPGLETPLDPAQQALARLTSAAPAAHP